MGGGVGVVDRGGDQTAFWRIGGGFGGGRGHGCELLLGYKIIKVVDNYRPKRLPLPSHFASSFAVGLGGVCSGLGRLAGDSHGISFSLCYCRHRELSCPNLR